jgi:hypothetical protein
MRIDELRVDYKTNYDGHTYAVVSPDSIGSPFWSMRRDVRKTGTVSDFKRKIVLASRRLAAEITELETGEEIGIDIDDVVPDPVDDVRDADDEIRELLDGAGLIPPDEWLRRYSLVRPEREM